MGGIISITPEGRSSSTSSTMRLEPVDFRKKVLEQERLQQEQQQQQDAQTPP
jgi:hypothetical protein